MKIPEKIKDSIINVASSIVVILFAVGACIIIGNLYSGYYNFYILSTGLLLIMIPLSIFWIQHIILFKDKDHSLKTIKELKRKGKKLKVDLTTCKIAKRKYSDDWPDDKGKAQSTDGSVVNVTYEKVSGAYTRIIHTAKVDEQEFQFVSQTIHKDKHLIEMLLDHHKTTVIYVDKTNPANYYFDVEFLQ